MEKRGAPPPPPPPPPPGAKKRDTLTWLIMGWFDLGGS